VTKDTCGIPLMEVIMELLLVERRSRQDREVSNSNNLQIVPYGL
jgi:hypothetical protein